MELSKLNINSIAKEEIRRKFFDSRLGKSKDDIIIKNEETDSQTKAETNEDKIEASKIEMQLLDEEPVEDEDGFPLITSVFSLASTIDNTKDPCENNSLSCDVSKELQYTENIVSMSDSNIKLLTMPPCNETVSIPINTTSPNVNVVTFIDATKQTVIPYSKTEVGSTSFVVDEKQTFLKDGNIENRCSEGETNQSTTNVQSIQTQSQLRETNLTNLSTNTEAFSDNINEYTSNDDVQCDTELMSSTEVENTPCSNEEGDNSDYVCANDGLGLETGVCKENIEEIPTRQEEKIRQLKDLLRKKEEELEKCRFKSKVVSTSVAAHLRENFVKKNPSLCRKSPRLEVIKNTESPSSSNAINVQPHSKPDNINSKTTSAVSENSRSSGKRKASTNGQTSTKFTNSENYKLVNVKILQGHTRTLAVPLKRNKSTISSLAKKGLNSQDRLPEKQSKSSHSNDANKSETLSNGNNVNKDKSDSPRGEIANPSEENMDVKNLKRKSGAKATPVSCSKISKTARFNVPSTAKISNSLLDSNSPIPKEGIRFIKLNTAGNSQTSKSSVVDKPTVTLSNQNNVGRQPNSSSYPLVQLNTINGVNDSNQLFAFVVGEHSGSTTTVNKTSKDSTHSTQSLNSTIRIPIANLQDKKLLDELAKLSAQSIHDDLNSEAAKKPPQITNTTTSEVAPEQKCIIDEHATLRSIKSPDKNSAPNKNSQPPRTVVSQRNLAPKPLLVTTATSCNHRERDSSRLILPKPSQTLSKSKKFLPSRSHSVAISFPPSVSMASQVTVGNNTLSQQHSIVGTTSVKYSNETVPVYGISDISNAAQINTAQANSAVLTSTVQNCAGVVSTVPPATVVSNLSSGKFLVCNFLPPSQTKNINNQATCSTGKTKLLLHVSNSGEMRNVGIMNDNKVYLYAKQVTALPCNSLPKCASNSNAPDFIPNPQDAEFKLLLGLEHIVKQLT